MTISKTTKTKEAQDISTSADNVIQILHKDHIKVQELFFQFSQAEENSAKEHLVKEILKELYVHASVEEELVYPGVRKSADDAEDLIDEANTEHHVVKLLMAELSEMKADDELYDSKVCVLAELVKHHIREEEKEMFDKMNDSGLDLEAIGQKVLKQKEVLKAAPLPKGKALVAGHNGRAK